MAWILRSTYNRVVSWRPFSGSSKSESSETESCEDAVVLPNSILLLKEYFPDSGYMTAVKTFIKGIFSSQNATEKLIYKYCGCSLLNGRPLDTVMIFMGGETGTGKSTTINNLFDDKHLCKTSSSRSETDGVSVISKRLIIKGDKGEPSFRANLAFVDVPGTLDTDATNEAKNVLLVQKFREKQLGNREVAKIPGTYVREEVYPNIVLFIAHATDTRILGTDSKFARSLKTFQNTANLIDRYNVNLIVVLTNCGALGCTTAAFQDKLKQVIFNVKQQTRDILGIKNVEVIPIENCPEDYNLTPIGEFFQLPNGDLSPRNLFQAMIRCFDRNQDYLGKMLVSHYFGNDCPEKRQKAEVKEFNEACSAMELATLQSSQLLETLMPSSIRNEGEDSALFSFQSMCHGYCPVTEQIKFRGPLIAFENSTLKTVKIGKRQFEIPDCVDVSLGGGYQSHRETFQKKGDYQKHMKQKYGLAVDYALVVSADLEGKWLKENSNSQNHQTFSMAHELKLASFRVKSFSRQKPSEYFQRALNRLPDSLSSETVNEYYNFFCTWGSHVIVEQSVGGTIQETCVIKNSSNGNVETRDVDLEVKGRWNLFLSGGGQYKLNDSTYNLQSLDVSSRHFSAVGGNNEIFFSDAVTNFEIKQWAQSVQSKPSELTTAIKLLPHYEFLEAGRKQNTLRAATEMYLSGRLTPNRLQADRNAISREYKEQVRYSPFPICFPKGALVSLDNGTVEIQNLTRETRNLTTLNLDSTSVWSEHFHVGNTRNTSFCTYLHKNDDILEEYLQLKFENGKTLYVSPGHLIFQYVPDYQGSIFGKQAHAFQIGDEMVYLADGKMETPKLVGISRKLLKGAYSPLTSTGTLIVDGFLVSSYALVESFQVAQAACLPLKLWSKLRIEPVARKEETTGFSTNQAMHLGINPYAKFLLAFRKSFNE